MRHTLCGWLAGAVMALGGLAAPWPALAHDDDDRIESRDERDDREDREDRDKKDD